MSKNYESKAVLIEEIKTLVDTCQSAVLVDYRGLTVEEDTALRKKLRAALGYDPIRNRIGEGYFVSYRDPNLGRTLEIYDGVPEYLENFTVSERDMTKYIIGTISNIDQPMTPATKGDRSMNLYMNHVSAEMIRKEREQILTANQEDIRALAGVARAVLANDQICVIGNEAKIEEEKELFVTVENLF